MASIFLERLVRQPRLEELEENIRWSFICYRWTIDIQLLLVADGSLKIKSAISQYSQRTYISLLESRRKIVQNDMASLR